MMHKDLIVYKKSHELVKLTFGFVDQIPQKEFEIISQMKKSVISVPSNIAEGAGRNSKKQLLNFLNISMGSLCELEAQYQICVNTGLSTPDPKLYDIIDHVGKLLNNLIKSLNNRVTEQQSNRVTE